MTGTLEESLEPTQEEIVRRTTGSSNVRSSLRVQEEVIATPIASSNGTRKGVTSSKTPSRGAKTTDVSTNNVGNQQRDRGNGVSYISLLSSTPAEEQPSQ